MVIEKILPSDQQYQKQQQLTIYSDQSQPHQEQILASQIIFQNIQQFPDRFQLFSDRCGIFQMLFVQDKSRQKFIFHQKDILRGIYRMQSFDQQIKLVQNNIAKLIPENLPIAKKLYPYYSYPNKNILSALATTFSHQDIFQSHRGTITQLLSSIECVILGYNMHVKTESKIDDWRIRLLPIRFKDSYLVLAGDFFHIKGSFEASNTGLIQISKIVSQLEISLAQLIYLMNQLSLKIQNKGYQTVTVEQIHQINLRKISPIMTGLLGMDIIKNHNATDKQLAAYEAYSLLFLYRVEIQSFMFNFPTIIKKFKQYSQDKIKLDKQDSLSYYIFFHAVKNSNNRIDIAYLNTIDILSSEIKYLQQILKGNLEQQMYQKVISRLKYFMMIYI